MKFLAKVLLLALLVASPIFGQVAVTGSLKDITAGNVTKNVQVDFELQNYGSQIPRVSGTTTLVALKKTFKPDTNGNISGSIYQNTVITPVGTFYRVCIVIQGTILRCNNYLINGPFDLNSAIPLNITPVVGPNQIVTSCFPFLQLTPSSTWTITHNENDANTWVQTATLAGKFVIPDDTDTLNPNVAVISWITPSTGRAVVCHGGSIQIANNQPNAIISNPIGPQTIGNQPLNVLGTLTATNPIVGSITGSSATAASATTTANLVGPGSISGTLSGNPTLSGQVTLTGAPGLTETNAGVFSSGAMNEYIQSLLNNCSPTTEYTLVQGAVFSTDAMTGCVAVPSTATGQHQQNAVAGYANSSCDSAGRTRCNAVGGYFSGRAIANNAAVWGINPVMQDLVGTTGTNLTNEFDTIVNGAPAQVIGLTNSLGGTGTMPVASYAYSVGAQGGLKWNYGYNVNRGSTTTYGVVIDGLNTTDNTFSAPLALIGYDSGGISHVVQIQADPSGIAVITPASGANVKLNSGVNGDGSGFKHKRVTTGSIGGTTRADVTVTWTSTFPDQSYTASCFVTETTVAAGTQSLVAERVHTVNNGSIVVSVFNGSGGALTGTLNCIAVHD